MRPRHLPIALSLALIPACTLDIKDLTAAGLDTTGSGATSDASTGDPTAASVTTGPATTGETTDSTTGGGGVPVTDVDILFIVDNSGSMAPVQQLLASGIGAMVDALDAADIDYRIAVTTTDVANPRCPAATYKPEAGNFVITSCRERIAEGEFSFNLQDFSDACLSACPHESLGLLPLSTPNNPVLMERPWLEKIDGKTNVSVPIAEAAACLLPQGVAGCGFEQPLEALHLAVSKTRPDPMGQVTSLNLDFLRDEADLLVVLVTDEVDCSFNPDFQDIFLSNKVFWNDPADPAPTSAMCWRAGTACAGGPGTYDECHAVDRGLDGMITENPTKAVLHPLSRYQSMLAQVQEDKVIAGSKGRVRVAAVVGVPAGYVQGGPIPFADAMDPDYQSDFGIGPGCSVASEPPRTGLPPLRIKELLESVPQLGNGLYSICDGALEDLPKAFGELMTTK